ncbi:uncharacterized protein V1518DRAFT_417371 [Limtongia smithiae]|uniref:uncharacterized protein n=1 Tax=Limtongia smithiae TaxID=1125753 RepID=UPI0034CD459B
MLPAVLPAIAAVSALTGILALRRHKTSSSISSRALVRELPQTGLTTCTLRPQFRTNNKLLNVYTRTGFRMFRFVRHQPASLDDTETASASGGATAIAPGLTYSLLDGRDGRALATVRVESLKSYVLFHGSDEMLAALGLVTVRHVVDAEDSYRVFILPDGSTYQWTSSTRALERIVVIARNGEHGSSGVAAREEAVKLPTDEYREQIAVAKRIGTRVWEVKFDETRLPAEVVFATALISMLDQWNTVFRVGGVVLKSDKNLASFQ